MSFQVVGSFGVVVADLTGEMDSPVVFQFFQRGKLNLASAADAMLLSVFVKSCLSWKHLAAFLAHSTSCIDFVFLYFVALQKSFLLILGITLVAREREVRVEAGQLFLILNQIIFTYYLFFVLKIFKVEFFIFQVQPPKFVSGVSQNCHPLNIKVMKFILIEEKHTESCLIHAKAVFVRIDFFEQLLTNLRVNPF